MTTKPAPPLEASDAVRADPVLEATDLYRFYHAGGEETLALRGVSLSSRPGEITVITGPSGSGKSTLLACLAGLDEPDGGTVRVAGETMSRRPEPERAALRARAVGMLFQTGNLVDHLTVEQNIATAQRLAGRHDRDRVRALLADVGLGARAAALPASLSGGEAARAGLAVALANDPPVVLADEPTGELDATTTDQIVQLLRRHADRGAAILVATHNPTLAAAADRAIELLDGSVRR